MQSLFRNPAIATILLSLAVLAGCEKPPQLNVVDASVQLSPVADRPSAGYFTVNGGTQDVKLLAVNVRDALKVEMHEMAMADGVMKMEPIYQVRVPAGKQMKFAPGGKHLMLWDIAQTAQKAGNLEIEFVFSNGDRILANAAIRKMGNNGG